MQCANTYYLDKHLAELDRADRREAAIAANANDLLDGEYDPFEVNNFNEAMAEMTDREMAEVSSLMRDGKHPQASETLASHISGYWRTMAYEKSERLAESCYHCFGRGCRKCEEP